MSNPTPVIIPAVPIIVPMPVPGAADAPEFNGRDVDCFLKKVLFHGRKANINDEDQLVDYLLEYCDRTRYKDLCYDLAFQAGKANRTWALATDCLRLLYLALNKPEEEITELSMKQMFLTGLPKHLATLGKEALNWNPYEYAKRRSTKSSKVHFDDKDPGSDNDTETDTKLSITPKSTNTGKKVTPANEPTISEHDKYEALVRKMNEMSIALANANQRPPSPRYNAEVWNYRGGMVLRLAVLQRCYVLNDLIKLDDTTSRQPPPKIISHQTDDHNPMEGVKRAPQQPLQPPPSQHQKRMPALPNPSTSKIPPPPNLINRKDGWKDLLPLKNSNNYQILKPLNQQQQTLPSGTHYHYTSNIQERTDPSKIMNQLLQMKIEITMGELIGVSQPLQKLVSNMAQTKRAYTNGKEGKASSAVAEVYDTMQMSSIVENLEVEVSDQREFDNFLVRYSNSVTQMPDN
ncbi:hypothetical protein BT96DRAFT_936696 [Gymnopus androsaceus JB14]|uniref:DUF4100 domain-containing protein n=1 Tax=Gymnopus androsaceus JB14 TaxID=1447944 RepID=A0A6A4HZN2_9AGAR|nr:hypothetical protein BT96DRAFT_936696 [Gymnopus androsaceus JB14]